MVTQAMLFPDSATEKKAMQSKRRASRRGSASAPETNAQLFQVREATRGAREERKTREGRSLLKASIQHRSNATSTSPVQVNVQQGASSDWINPLLRHAIYSHNIDHPPEVAQPFSNWASPGLIQPSREKPKIRLDPEDDKKAPSRRSSGPPSSVFEGDVFIRTFMKVRGCEERSDELRRRLYWTSTCNANTFYIMSLLPNSLPFLTSLTPPRLQPGEAVFRVEAVNNETQNAVNDRGAVVRISEVRVKASGERSEPLRIRCR